MKRDNLILETITVENNTVTYKFSYTDGLKLFFNTDKLILKYDFDISNIPESILTIPFVGSLIALTWLTNSVMWVKDIDKTFYQAIPNIKRAYQEIYSHYKFGGRFVPSILTTNHITHPNVDSNALLLFSGGVDAHTSYIRNKEKKPLLCNIQGLYSDIHQTNQVAEADFRDITQFALTHGLRTTFVKSNFAKIVNVDYFRKTLGKKVGDSWWHGFSHSMAFLSISIPIAYSHGIQELIIASSLTTGLNRFCASNTTTDNEFNFAGTGHTLHDGFELSRQDKIKIIVDYQRNIHKPYYLRVCSFNDHNCCQCEKCFRTILGIVAEKGDPKDFGFQMNQPIAQHWQNVLKEHAGLMGFNSEQENHWPYIKKRMQENYNSMNNEQKEFVDWFMNFDFRKAKRYGVIKYYFENFFSILKRKLFNQ